MSGSSMPIDAALEARLRAAGADAVWPATPDLRGPVVARIQEAAGSAPADARPAAQPPRRPLVRALVLALVALLVLAGVAAALGFRLPGLDIVFVERIPTASGATGPAIERAEILVGSPVPLDQAAGLPGRPVVRLPAALPPPTTAWIHGSGGDRIVTTAWAANPGQPSIDDSGLALVLTAAPGRIERPLLEKALTDDSTIELARVGGNPGWWISGAQHQLMILSPESEPVPVESRLAGDVLVFERDGTVYRLESALGRDVTIAIAETMP
jgi:hypothetical protein